MHESRLRPLLEAVLAIGSGLDLQATLRRLVESAADLTGAANAVLLVPGPGPRDPPRVRATTGPTAPPAADPRALAVPVPVGDEEFGELLLTRRRAAGPFTAEDERVAGLLAAQAGIAIGNARLYETAQQRERWIEGVAAVTTALLDDRPADDALSTVAERARQLAGAAAGVVLQPTAEGGMAIVAASAPEDPGGLVGATIAPGSPVLEQLFSGEPVFVEDSATDPRMTTEVRHRFGPSMMLPLRAEGRLIGTLALPRRRGDRPYTDVERSLATRFAAHAALALVLAEARRGRSSLAVYEDRERIARDLHDLVVQRLFATGLMLESAQRRPDTEEGVRETLSRAMEDLRGTVQEVRTTIMSLQQDPDRRYAGLRSRVLRETTEVAARLGFPPSVHFTGAVDSRVSDQVAEALMAELRRLLGAAGRRAGVTRIDVVVDVTAPLPNGPAGVRLTVSDDSGRGTSATWRSSL
ncbi:GAF domain-containing protein [Streptomyces sp. ZYX-F-203]